MDRRRPAGAIDEDLRRRGFAFVAQPGETFSPRDAARIERTVELLAGMEERSWPFRRRRRRPLWQRWQRLWTQRPWKPLAVLGAVALVSTLFATEFRITDYRDDRAATKPSRPSVATPAGVTAPVSAPTPGTPTPAASPTPKVIETAASAASRPAAAAAPIPPATTPPSPATIGAAEHSGGTTLFTSLTAPTTPPRTASSQTASAPRTTSERDAAARAAAKPAIHPESTPRAAANDDGLTEAVAAPAAPATPAAATPVAMTTPAPPAAPAPIADLRLEMSRRPTSATGGGFVYTVRVLDRNGEPRSDAQVWIAAGRRGSGAQYEARMHRAEAAGTYRSGVVHPSTLPPDMIVKAQVGNQHVEAALER